MTRNLRALGLALVAVFVMGVWVAQGVSAHVAARFTAPEVSTITGEETVTNIINSVTGVGTSCKSVLYHGVTPASESAESLTINAIYKECVAEAGIFGTIEVEEVTGFGPVECHYRLNADESVDLACGAGKEVTIKAATCTMHIPAQNDLGTISFTTATREIGGIKKHDLLVHWNLSGITSNHTDGFGCPLSSGGESATATFVGTTTVWAEGHGFEPLDLTWDATVA